MDNREQALPVFNSMNNREQALPVFDSMQKSQRKLTFLFMTIGLLAKPAIYCLLCNCFPMGRPGLIGQFKIIKFSDPSQSPAACLPPAAHSPACQMYHGRYRHIVYDVSLCLLPQVSVKAPHSSHAGNHIPPT